MNNYAYERYQPIGSWQAIDEYWDEINGASDPESVVEYEDVVTGIESGDLCQKDGRPCEFETRHFKDGEDADGNRGWWVSETACIKCGETAP